MSLGLGQPDLDFPPVKLLGTFMCSNKCTSVYFFDTSRQIGSNLGSLLFSAGYTIYCGALIAAVLHLVEKSG